MQESSRHLPEDTSATSDSTSPSSKNSSPAPDDSSSESPDHDRTGDDNSESINDGQDDVTDLIDDRSDSELTISSELDEIEILDLKAEQQEKKRKIDMEKGKWRKGRKQNERLPMWFCNYAEKWWRDRKRRHEDDDDSSDGGGDFSVSLKGRCKHFT